MNEIQYYMLLQLLLMLLLLFLLLLLVLLVFVLDLMFSVGVCVTVVVHLCVVLVAGRPRVLQTAVLGMRCNSPPNIVKLFTLRCPKLSFIYTSPSYATFCLEQYVLESAKKYQRKKVPLLFNKTVLRNRRGRSRPSMHPIHRPMVAVVVTVATAVINAVLEFHIS